MKHTFVKKGQVLRVYQDGKYVHSIPIKDAVKVANTMKDAVRATGPVSTVITMIEDETAERGEAIA